MNEEARPNPEQLLKAIQKEENKSGQGHLKIFLGMAAGVGKTYAMLEAAQRLRQVGLDVVVGVVNTHGRQETARLLEGLKIIPPKSLRYRDTIFEEMDIDEIIRAKPQLVLVDEFAHSNVPGSRHPKRWQDVMEILDHGIDVFTTLNVQHIESLKDVVESIAGISIKETVPDSIIESASFIELIDLTTDELLQRLKDGKVYLGDKSEIAIQHFFQPDRLTALREIVLRYTAEKVDHDLQEMVSTIERAYSWKPRERLLVAVSHSPHSQKLIRTTRRIASNLDAPWIAIHVNDGRSLEEPQQMMLGNNLTLARDLGAEVITTDDTDVPQGIQRIARQRGVTQIIIGRQPQREFFRFLFKNSLIDQLTTLCPEVDIHIIRQTQSAIPAKSKSLFSSEPIKWSPYIIITIFVFLLTLINSYAVTGIGYKLIGFVYLVGILFLSLFFRKGPIIYASILSALTWDIFFIQTMGTFIPAYNEDTALLLLFLFTAIITGVLSDRAKRHREMLIKREQTVEALYVIARSIATPRPIDQTLLSVKTKLQSSMGGKFEILLKKTHESLNFDESPELTQAVKEMAAANWVFQNGQEAGWSTTTLPASQNYYIPLKGPSSIFGVLAYKPDANRELSIEDKNFLYNVGQQLANLLEKHFGNGIGMTSTYTTTLARQNEAEVSL